MIEVFGDMWTLRHEYNAVCVTVNWEVNSRGDAIMGAGCAKEALQFYPDASRYLGNIIRAQPGQPTVEYIASTALPAGPQLLAFPTKFSWRNPARADLIQQSCHQLNIWMSHHNPDYKVLLPRPGTGKGGLDWFKTVKPLCEGLDNRVHIVSFAIHQI